MSRVGNSANEQFRAPTSGQVRPTDRDLFLQQIVRVAGDTPGKFVLAGIREGSPIDIRHVMNEPDVNATLTALRDVVDSLNSTPGTNIYINIGLMRVDLPAGLKGTEADVVGDLAAVLDFDGKHDGATRFSRVPLVPHMEVETSPGNYQLWWFFDRPYPVADFKPVVTALVRCAGTDSTISGEHLFRVPDTFNCPTQKKIAEGRDKAPYQVRIRQAGFTTDKGIGLEGWIPDSQVPRLCQFDTLRDAIVAKWPDAFDRAATENGPIGDLDWDQPLPGMSRREVTDEALAKALDVGAPGRSEALAKAINVLAYAGCTPNETVARMMEHSDALAFGHYPDEGTEAALKKDVERLFKKPNPNTPNPAEKLRQQLPPPSDLFGMLTPEPVLTRDMLPKVIADFAFDQAERMGVVPAMVAMPAIIASAACLHDGFTIAPKKLDREFTQSARLWGCLVCGVSDLKTPAVNAAVKPVWEIHLERASEYKQKFAEYKINHQGWKAAQPDQAAIGKATPEPEAPIKRKLITTDPTMESVAAILADNRQGILIYRDELAGWVGSFGAYQTQGGGKDRTLALELYNGGPKTFDRVKADVDVSNWSASIIGTIQLAKLREMAPKLEDDGFLQRFLLVPGGRVPTGDVDREPNYAAESAYRMLVRQLVELDPGENRPSVRLSGDARQYWNEVTALGHALADMPGVPAALVGFLNKITGNFARLLLAFHAITQVANNAKVDDDVSGDTAHRARDLVVQFIFPAVERVYAECFSPSDEGLQAVQWIAGHILARKVERLTDRDFYRAAHHKMGLAHPENDRWARKQAMDILVAAGWAYPDGDTAWKINPQIHDQFAERGEAERLRRDAAIERINRGTEAMRKSYGK